MDAACVVHVEAIFFFHEECDGLILCVMNLKLYANPLISYSRILDLQNFTLSLSHQIIIRYPML